jgi:hypothetical protein
VLVDGVEQGYCSLHCLLGVEKRRLFVLGAFRNTSLVDLSRGVDQLVATEECFFEGRDCTEVVIVTWFVCVIVGVVVHSILAGRMEVTGAKMERTVRTRSYQDPLEGAFEKRFPWSFILADTTADSPIHIVADDMSGREFSLPAGVILEMAEAIQFQRSLAN